MWIVAVAWMFVVTLMTVAEALSPVGSVLGAVITFFLYGVGPMSLVMYLLGTPWRRRARRASLAQGDAGRLPTGDAVATERKET